MARLYGQWPATGDGRSRSQNGYLRDKEKTGRYQSFCKAIAVSQNWSYFRKEQQKRTKQGESWAVTGVDLSITIPAD